MALHYLYILYVIMTIVSPFRVTIGRICRHSLLDFMQVRMCTSQMSRKAQERIVSMYHSLEALGYYVLASIIGP